MNDLDVEDLGRFVWRDRDQRFTAFLIGCSFAAVNREPAWIFDDFAVRSKRVFFHAGDSRRDFKLRRGEKYADEPAHDHVVDLLLHFVETVRHGAGRNDREVIGNLRVIENSF